MKETPLTQAFEDAMRRFSAEPVHKHIASYLETIQKTVLEFQEAGVDISLTVRDGDAGTELQADEGLEGKFLCNGEITMGAARLDFAIAQAQDYSDDPIQLKIYRGDVEVLARQSSYDWDRKKWQEDAPEFDEDEGAAWSRGDRRRSLKTDLGSALARCLLEIKTQQDFFARFNVGSKGHPDEALQKNFSVIPALRLKKPEGP